MLDFLLEIFYPTRCVNCGVFGKYICDACFAKINFVSFSKCSVCMKPSISGLTHARCRKRTSLDGVFVALEYKSVIKRAISQYKYDPYIYKLSSVFAQLMHENYIQNEVLEPILSSSSEMWITCVPLHKRRQKGRGYNQSALLGKILAEKFKIKFSDDILMRIRDTQPQFKLKKEARQKNISGAFEVSSRLGKKIKDKTVFVVDDVFTTGSTLRECGKVLKGAGVKKVYALCLAMEQ